MPLRLPMTTAISRLRMTRSRCYSTLDLPPRKVTVLGAAGAIGEPLSMLLKMNPFISNLALYDASSAPTSVAGVATDVSHMSTTPQVAGYMGEEQLGKALEGSDIVIIPAGVPHKPSMSRDEFFKINAGIVKSMCTAIAKHCPEALLNMMCNPLNSTVLIAAEVFKKAGIYNEKKLFGVTMLDVVQAKTLYAAKTGLPVKEVDIPVVGGHSGITILPLFSQATPKPDTPLSDEDIQALTKRIQDEGTDVVEAKEGKSSAKLSMAFAGAKFADTCLAGLDGVPDVVEYAFVQSSITELPFFASRHKRYLMRRYSHPKAWDIVRRWYFTLDELDLIQRARLDGIRLAPPLSVDVPMLTALMERWCPNTNTFHIPSKEITPTLVDVYSILGVPMEGTLVQKTSHSDSQMDRLSTWLIGSTNYNM